MTSLTVEEIIRLHRKLIERTGGRGGLRDRGLLESAIYGADSAFDGVEAYPSVCEKAARLAYALIRNHAFVDGNKRTGVLAMLTTLRLNGVSLCYTQKELIKLGLGAANGTLQYEDILAWIEKHKAE